MSDDIEKGRGVLRLEGAEAADRRAELTVGVAGLAQVLREAVRVTDRGKRPHYLGLQSDTGKTGRLTGNAVQRWETVTPGRFPNLGS